MEMRWDEKSREMRFSVFQKPNQALKYVDKASTHRPTTFKSIANLLPPMDFPTFQELWQDNERQKLEPIKSKRSKWDQCL
eukprot:3639106-Ditylum_brightwellii.AAC.1